MQAAFSPIVNQVQVNQQKLQIRISQKQVPSYLQLFFSRCIKKSLNESIKYSTSHYIRHRENRSTNINIIKTNIGSQLYR